MVKEDYKQTELGVIPECWQISSFENCFKILSNNTLSRAELNEEEGTVKNIHYGDILVKYKNILDCATERIPYINDLNKKSNLMFLISGDLIIADTAEDENVGKAVEIANVGEQKVVSGLHTIPCRSISPDMFADGWLGYYINHSIYHDQLLPFITGTKVSAISKSAIAGTLLLVPPMEEQKLIAEVLADIDVMISFLEKLIEKKKAIKQGAMQDLLTGKKRLPGFTGDWEDVLLGDLCYLITKQTGFDYTNEIKPSLVEINSNATLPFVQNKDFNGKSVNLKTDYYIPYDIAIKYPRILLNETCMLISLSGRIGNIGLFDKSRGIAFIGGAVGICRFSQEQMAEWCMLFLQSSIGQKQIFENQKSGAQHNLTVEDVRKLTIKKPCTIEEQNAIAYILSDMDSEIEELEQKLNKTRKLKQGMMQQLLTGKIRLV